MRKGRRKDLARKFNTYVENVLRMYSAGMVNVNRVFH